MIPKIDIKECVKNFISFFLGVIGVFLIQFSGVFIFCTESPETFFEILIYMSITIGFLVPGLYLVRRF